MPTIKAIHRCVHCTRQDGLTQIAHRDAAGYIVGWLMVCVDCIENVVNADVKIVLED